MMISFKGQAKAVRLEESGFIPPTVGDFFDATIKRRGFALEYVSEKCGINLALLEDILTNKCQIDKKISKKIDILFPKVGRMLLVLQMHRQFYEKFGVARPSSPWRRANVIRASRRRNLALTF